VSQWTREAPPGVPFGVAAGLVEAVAEALGVVLA
jgi:hypothetical protein